MTSKVYKEEVHTLKFTVGGFDGTISLEDLEGFVTTLKANGWTGSDKIAIFGASTNQKAILSATRSVLYDKMDEMDKTVYDLENR